MTTTWLDLPADHPFGLANLPYGVFSTPGTSPRVGVRVGDWVLDAGAALGAGRYGVAATSGVGEPSLNAFLADGRPAWAAARAWLTSCSPTRLARGLRASHTWCRSATSPCTCRSRSPTTSTSTPASTTPPTSGRIFRPDSEPLTPNWKHLPIGYHGRAGTVVVSGTDIVRPRGQRKAPSDPAPSFGPSVRLDIEAELGFVVGGATASAPRCRSVRRPSTSSA